MKLFDHHAGIHKQRQLLKGLRTALDDVDEAADSPHYTANNPYGYDAGRRARVCAIRSPGNQHSLDDTTELHPGLQRFRSRSGRTARRQPLIQETRACMDGVTTRIQWRCPCRDVRAFANAIEKQPLPEQVVVRYDCDCQVGDDEMEQTDMGV